jgi:ABC-2 type transport system permease protein
MLGIALSTLFRYREQSLLFLLWTSIPILLLSGASFPSEAIPSWLYNFGKIFPSSSGVNGYIRIRTMGATLRDVLPELRTLWMLVFIYGGLACLGIRRVTRRND